mmetsp:Transcript_58834/g.140295  ORF Transcript_58834/g.140295 Transcript_58834/m.140295 type:complete len:117 (+) Transcript_58834:104-454(+)
MQLSRMMTSLLTAVALALVSSQTAAAMGLRAAAGTLMSDCPLCVAEENCHMACADVRGQSPGSKYCLESCIGAHPDDEFGEAWFAAADAKARDRAELDARLKQLGDELAEDVKQRR